MVYIDKKIAIWVMQQPNGRWHPDMQAIGDIGIDGKLIAGIAVESENDNCMWGHLRIIAPPSKQFWINAADYIFNQRGKKRFSAVVEADNIDAVMVNLHIGFVLEAVLKEAGRDGDLLIMTLWKKNCRFLNWIQHA